MSNHYLLFYEKASDYKTLQITWQKQHLDYVLAAIDAGDITLAGSLDNPDDGSAVILFQSDSALTAKNFAAADPYVLHGVVSRWYVRRWNVLSPSSQFRSRTTGGFPK
jgi:uncharacterized protein